MGLPLGRIPSFSKVGTATRRFGCRAAEIAATLDTG
jgi:hypothetical protein